VVADEPKRFGACTEELMCTVHDKQMPLWTLIT
jgi:hypothetical protein